MKITDEVFENRCRYCIHGSPEAGNKDIRKEWIYSQFYRKDLSCRIFGISRFDEVPGECLDFSPHHIFGICYTCEYDNCFHEPTYCTRAEQPNKRQVFIGNGGLGGAHHPNYWKNHVLSTCDAYMPNHNWLDIMCREAADGKIPRNFDPETMKPVGHVMENETAQKWAEIDRQQAAEKESKQNAEEKTEIYQPSLFDLEGK